MKLLQTPEVGAGWFGVTDSERREVPTREPGQASAFANQVPLEALSGGEFSPCSALTLALQIHKLLGFSGATQRLSRPCGFTLGVLHLCFPDSLEGKLCRLSAEGEDLFGEV